MTMDPHRVVEGFDILKYQPVCMVVIEYLEVTYYEHRQWILRYGIRLFNICFLLRLYGY